MDQSINIHNEIELTFINSRTQILMANCFENIIFCLFEQLIHPKRYHCLFSICKFLLLDGQLFCICGTVLWVYAFWFFYWILTQTRTHSYLWLLFFVRKRHTETLTASHWQLRIKWLVHTAHSSHQTASTEFCLSNFDFAFAEIQQQTTVNCQWKHFVGVNGRIEHKKYGENCARKLQSVKGWWRQNQR